MSPIKNHMAITAIFLIAISFGSALTAYAYDEVGVYWNSTYTNQHVTTSGAFESVTGYIVIHEPALGGGILAWECAVGITGPAVVTSWQIEGQAINAQSPPSFAVGLDSPLPSAAAVMVASFNLLVTDYPVPIDVSLEPIYFASIEGQMAYIDSLDPEQLRVMTPVSGEPVVATVNGNTGYWCATDWQHVVYFGPVVIGESLTQTFYVDSCGGSRYLDISLSCSDPTLALTGLSGPVFVADSTYILIEVTYTPTEVVPLDCTLVLGEGWQYPIYGVGEEPVGVIAPTPLAVQQDGQIALEWPARAAEDDRYHVYRKDPQGRENRLTDTPLLATNATVRFTDQPDYPGGTVLHYSYGVVHGEVELSRSPAVEVTVKSLPKAKTQLLTNVPNPFNPQTRIRFELARNEQVRVTVFDLTGKLVKTLINEQRQAGENSVIWQGRDEAGRPVSSGAYYVRLETDSRVDHQKIMMLK